MPLFYTDNMSAGYQIAMWHITEDEGFFRGIVIPHREIPHPRKRIQHLAGRYLLRILDPHFPVNEIRLYGKRPYLTGNSYFFSISHCMDYAAVILSKDAPVGVDVELSRPKVGQLQSKFLTEEEVQIISSAQSPLPLEERFTVCWCAKECMFKWYGHGLVDFKRDMIIRSFPDENTLPVNTFFGKEKGMPLSVHFRFFGRLCLAWLSETD